MTAEQVADWLEQEAAKRHAAGNEPSKGDLESHRLWKEAETMRDAAAMLRPFPTSIDLSRKGRRAQVAGPDR